ncbi:MAG: 3-deoxy-D-manno-octulosonic acid transferase [Lacipirellulaceae bacterium]
MSPLARWSLNGLYGVALVAALPWLAWRALRTGKNREGFSEKLLGRVPARGGDRPCVWLHAVSVGEVNLLAVLLKELRARRPEWDLVVSTTTKTGYDLAQKKYGAEHTVFYCPSDFSWAVDEAMRRMRPALLLLAELELWPNLVAGAKRNGAQVAVVNGRLSENSFRGYRRVAPLVRGTFAALDLVAAQDAATRERFVALGARPRAALVTGSLKYDGAQTDRDNPRTAALRSIAEIAADDPVWLVGSTQAPEEEIALRVYQRLAKDHPALRLVIVPRHPERFDEVADAMRRSGVDFARRSELGASPLPAGGGSNEARSPFRVPPSALLIDTVGELGAWWGLATIGFVGGSFGDRGGQNMIEPSAYGVATCFGPNTWNFRDIVAALLAADGARVVADEGELEAFVRGCLERPDEALALGARARAFVTTQLGATARTVDLLEGLLDGERLNPKALMEPRMNADERR